MNGPADVVAVLERAYQQAGLGAVGAAMGNIQVARAAVAKLQQLVLAIDDECSNAKPDFGRVVKLAAEASALARVGGAA